MCLPSGFRIALPKDHPHHQHYHCFHHQGLQETNALAIFFRSSSFQPKKKQLENANAAASKVWTRLV